MLLIRALVFKRARLCPTALSDLATSRSSAVRFVGHLLHPLDHSAIEDLGDGSMRHRGHGGALCPCFSPGSNQTTSPAHVFQIGPPSHFTRPQPAVTIKVCPSGCVPGSARLGFERHYRATDARGCVLLEWRVDPHGTCKPVRGPAHSSSASVPHFSVSYRLFKAPAEGQGDPASGDGARLLAIVSHEYCGETERAAKLAQRCTHVLSQVDVKA